MMQLIRLAAPNTTRWGIRGDEERNKSDLARNLEAKKRDHAVFKEKNSTSGDEINSLEDKTIYKPVRRTIGRLRGGGTIRRRLSNPSRTSLPVPRNED